MKCVFGEEKVWDSAVRLIYISLILIQELSSEVV
jgi:hypothetical protein